MSKYKHFFIGFFCLFGASSLLAQEQNMTIPAGDLYGNTWQSEHLRLKSYRVNDTVNLCLVGAETPDYVMPVKTINVISPYGWRGTRMHTGIDLKLNYGDTIYAVFDGMVRMAKPYANYGNLIAIRHANGLESIYAHLSEFFVAEKQFVKAGEPIGLAGRTGRATTEHLHFEVRFRYEHFDPELIFDFENQCLYNDYLCFINGRLDKGEEEPLFNADSLLLAELEEEQKEVETQQQEVKAQPKTQKHRIKKGETLYSIARSYGITVDQICSWNNIANPSLIHMGQMIIVSN